MCGHQTKHKNPGREISALFGFGFRATRGETRDYLQFTTRNAGGAGEWRCMSASKACSLSPLSSPLACTQKSVLSNPASSFLLACSGPSFLLKRLFCSVFSEYNGTSLSAFCWLEHCRGGGVELKPWLMGKCSSVSTVFSKRWLHVGGRHSANRSGSGINLICHHFLISCAVLGYLCG